MGRATELLQLPTQVLMQGGARRRKLIFVGIGAVVLTAAVATAGAMLVVDSGKAVTLHKEWSSFQGCLLGAPLAPDERPSSRYRVLALSQLGAKAEAKPADASKVWPSSCLGALGGVVDNASRAAAGGDELAKTATAVGKAINTATLGASPKLLDELWKAAVNAKMTDAPGPRHETTPPGVPVLFPRAQFEAMAKPFGDFPLGSIRAELSPTSQVRFLVDDGTNPKGPTLCQAEPGSATALACTPLGPDVAKLTPGLRLLGAAEPGALPLVFAGDRGVFRELSASFAAGPTLGGTSKAGKRARVLARKPAGLFLVESGKDKDPPTETRLREATDAAALAGDWIFVREKDVLTVQRAPSTAGGVPEKVVELGPMKEALSKKAEDRVVSCRAGSTEAVRLRGAEHDYVTLGSNGEWSAPREVRATDQLSCGEGFATMATTTHNDVGGRVHATVRYTRCTSAECKETQLSHYDMVGGNADLLPAARGELAVGMAGSRLVFAWFTAMGDLRVRSGDEGTVASAPDVVLQVGGDEGGVALREVALVPSTTGTVLLARTDGGVRLFAFGQDGSVVPAVAKF